MYEYATDTIHSLNLNSLDLGDKKYDELCQIGCGAYGTVFKARDLQNPGNYVAMKKLRVKLNEDGMPMSTLREISILKQLDSFEHPNIVRFYDVIHQNILSDERHLTVYLIFEHVDQDLGSYMERCPPPGLNATKVKELTRQMLSGVDFLHSHRIIHRDLKPQNLLITKAGGLKIADFGLAKTFDYDMMLTSVVVTLWYRAPEILLNLGYGTPVDIWSIGCVMAEMWRLLPLFCATTEVEQLKCIFRIIGTPSMNEWPDNIPLLWSSFEQYSKVAFSSIFQDCCSKANSLLESMLTFNPAHRISAAEALEHPYFTDKENEPL
uniref:cyclin-dependent kinase n=1 Tax=Cacopsylla melanoneura TaxID=428564 RepID=A0A8D9A4W0_9HEMI